MSIANLQNATWLDVNCKSINTQPAGQWATGAIAFLGTNIPAGVNANYTVINGVVTIILSIPETVVAGAAQTQITFANVLPTAIFPECTVTGFVYMINTTNQGNSNSGIWQIEDDGTVAIVLTANATDAENYRLSLVMQYCLV